MLSCILYLQHGISRPVGRFILVPLDILGHIALGRFIMFMFCAGMFYSCINSDDESNFWDCQTWLFFHSWFREEETVMRLARTARGFGDPLAGNWYKQLLLIFFLFLYFHSLFSFLFILILLAMFARMYLLKSAALWGTLGTTTLKTYF
jgi:hypothetical protein